MDQLNFSELMRKADTIADLNAKELYLHEARANYQQTALDAENFLKKVESVIIYYQKVKELSVTFTDSPDEVNMNANNLKISTCLIFELLKIVGKGRSANDLTTLATFASLINGFSKENILNITQKGYYFSERHHGAVIKEVNDVLQQLRLPFAIDMKKKY